MLLVKPQPNSIKRGIKLNLFIQITLPLTNWIKRQMTNVCKEAKNVWKGRENILKGGSTNQSDEKKYY